MNLFTSTIILTLAFVSQSFAMEISVGNANVELQIMSNKIEALTTTVNTFDGRITTNANDVTTNTTAITALNSRTAVVEGRVELLEAQNLDARITAIETNTVPVVVSIKACSDAGMIFAPGEPGRDVNGCISAGSEGEDMDILVINKETCTYNKSKRFVYTLNAQCPATHKVISCSGGGGTINEEDSGSHIVFLRDSNKCQLRVSRPDCGKGSNIKQKITAVCYKAATRFMSPAPAPIPGGGGFGGGGYGGGGFTMPLF